MSYVVTPSAKQSLLESDPCDEDFPLGQLRQLLDPVEDWYCPLSHESHELSPGEGWYFPLGQESHELSVWE